MLAAIAIAIVVLSGSLVGPLALDGRRPGKTNRPAQVGIASLRADLIAGARTIKVPSNLRPPLSAMASALPRIIADGCELGFGRDQIKPCIYGDRGSHTTVVLFGDSHAGHWFDALNWISNRRHWRLVVMTKEGCTPAEVTFRDDPNSLCARWREKAKARIARLHPALVIVSWARWMEPLASQKAGVPTGYGGPWQDGAGSDLSVPAALGEAGHLHLRHALSPAVGAGLRGRSSVRRAPMHRPNEATQRSFRRSRRQNFGSPSRSRSTASTLLHGSARRRSAQ